MAREAGARVGPTYIVLTDDWELRGNGTGRVEDLQQRPALRLMDLYDRLGVKSTFNVEVMQQLAFEKHANANATIRSGRDAWRETVRVMLSRGFDVQLHLHPQWLGAKPVNGWWKLGKRWHIADYTADEIGRMLDEALGYLEPLVAPHRIRTFRAGSWGMGPPSRAVLAALAHRGIKLDVSVVNGSYYNGETITLDYRSLECPFLPYRPDLDDIRRCARSPETAAAVIEIPTQSVSLRTLITRLAREFARGRDREALRQAYILLRDSYPAARLRRLVRKNANPAAPNNAPDFVPRDPFGLASGRGFSDFILDLSSNYGTAAWRALTDICISRVERARRPINIVVLENHTKDVQNDSDLKRIEQVIDHIRRRHPHAEFRTLAEIAQQTARLL